MLLRRDFLVASLAAAAGALAASALACAPPAPTGAAAAAAYHASRRFLPLRQGRIAYVDRGAGPDVALFLHGFPLCSYQWRGAIDRLSRLRRCLAPDTMALGYTEVAEAQPVTPAAQVTMLVDFLDALGIAGVDLVANDSGGALAQLLLVLQPARIRSLLLTNCDVETDSPPAALQPIFALARRGRFADEAFAPQLADKRFARSKDGMGGLCYFDPAHPTDDAIETYFTPLVSSPRRKALCDAYALALEPNPLAGIEATLRRCRVPTRIVWGMADTIFSPRSPDYLASVLPDVRGIHRLPQAKLFFPEELPDVVAEEARALWNAS